jgi:hypothetical protein
MGTADTPTQPTSPQLSDHKGYCSHQLIHVARDLHNALGEA